jgi:hypothetical protein
MRLKAQRQVAISTPETNVRGNINSALHLASYIEGDLNDLLFAVHGAESGGASSSSTGLKSVPKHTTLLSDSGNVAEILNRCQDKLRSIISALGINQAKDFVEG